MNGENRKPAQVFHPSEYIVEELNARKWTTRDLALRMKGDATINECALEIYIAAGADFKLSIGTRLGDMAQRIGEAFGTSTELWVNLERAYLEHHKQAGTSQ